MLKRSSPRNCKMTFIIGRGSAGCQILKKWKWPYLVNWVEYFDKLLRKHWYWQDLAQEIANWHFYRSRLCRAPNYEKVKMALSLELWRILWWNFAYTLILTRCSQWDCQMIFGIGRGFAEVQILKKVKLALSLEPFDILIKFCTQTEGLPNLAQEIAKWHLTSVGLCRAPDSEKSENGRTEWTVVMKLCIHIDIDKM